ncbi:TWiK family of potassium channels protein 18-like isoform X2 [Neocloeon triangulifer]|uniref:TWiK family of potassium channels protein 18-like isoform X2 n=1 Tax=Neocloeon triangulifer TaxID=2078957 RepID=UPI00286F5F3A|nr:TWiK family of potassium channels protein 18-like isoform X2 [Neocloeon triangulifer]
MMENAGSVASIRRPVTTRSYSEYQYHYRSPSTPTAATTANGVGGVGGGRKERGGCRCCRKCCSTPAASTLGNLGVCCLVLGYTVLGAFTFMALEGGIEGRGHISQQARHERVDKMVNEMRVRTVERLWTITEALNILYKDNWTQLASHEVIKFQDSLVHTLKTGGGGGQNYRGGGGTGSLALSGPHANHRWTFSSSFLYSLTLITTIGYGGVTPKTTWGRIVTIVYALVGIPLMLVYLSTVGDLLARNFRRLYGKLCSCSGGGSSTNSSANNSGKPSPNDNYRVRHISSKQNSVDGGLKLHPEEELVKLERNHPLDFPADTPSDSRQNFVLQHHHPQRQRVPMTLCLALIAAYIGGGAMLFQKLENWSLLEGSFFCFTSLGTIGFGDLLPGAQPNMPAKNAQVSILSTSAYLLVGMALIAMCFNLLQDEVVAVGRRMGRICGLVRRRRRRHHEEHSESEVDDLAMAVVSGTS